MANHLRSSETPGNTVPEGEPTLAERFRRMAGQLSRWWALSCGSETLDHLRTEVRFYEEVRVYMAKFDAEERRASGQPIPDEVRRLLSELVAVTTVVGEVVDIYQAAGIPKPSLSDLGPDFARQAQRSATPHLAIEALRALLAEESARAAGSSLVQQRAFSERLAELMRRYTNHQLTSAEVIAELIAMAQDIAERADRGNRFTPPLAEDELAFYDAVAQNESAVDLMGDEVLAQIARELLAVMRRDIKTDWTVRDDVRAKLRSSVKRLLVKYKYPPDKQPQAITLVIEQMEALARGMPRDR